MTPDRANAIALLSSSLAMLLVMALHPTGHDLHADLDGMAARSRAVHALAIVATAAMFFGVSGVWRRLRTATPSLADAGLCCLLFGSIAAMFAALASGFVSTPLMLDMHRAEAAEKQALHAAADASFYFNQACALCYVTASGAAIVLWSWAGLSRRALPRHLAGYGMVMALASTALATAGHLRMDVHGFGAVVLGQSIWWVGCAVVLGWPRRSGT